MVTAASRLSSSWAKWLVAALAAAAAALLILLAAGAFDRDDGRRAAVARYIDEVNAVQRGLGIELARVNTIYGRVRRNPGMLSDRVDDLARGERAMRTLRSRLDALRPPPEAATLDAEFLRLLSMQVAFAHDVTQLGRYLPALSAEQKKLLASSQQLGRDIESAGDATAQAGAFSRFVASLERVAGRLSQLQAPPALEPGRRRENERVRRLAGLAERIREALESGQAREVEPLLRSLARTAGAGVTQSERRAIIAYNARLRRIDDQRAVVQKERLRLDRDLR
jgi:hypothetical protein